MNRFGFLYSISADISRGLERTKPRPAAKRFKLLWVAAILVGFYSWSSFYHVQNIIAHSELVQAEVIGKETRGRRSQTRHYVHYSFPNGAGDTQGVLQVSVVEWYRMLRGDTFDLYYYTAHPPSSLHDIEKDRRHAALFAFVALILALLAAATQYFETLRRASPTGAL